MTARTKNDYRKGLAWLMIVSASMACASSPRAVQVPGVEAAAEPPALRRAFAETRGAFIVRLGVDTIAVEQYTRSSQLLEGELIRREPRTVSIRYRAALDAQGHVSSLEATAQPAGGAPMQPVRLEFRRDTVVARVPTGDSLRVNRIPVQGIAVPWLGNSYALAEQAIMQALPPGGARDSTTILQVGLGGQRPSPAYVRRGPGVVELEYFGAPVVIRVDDAGRIQSADGSATASKIMVERVPSVNIAQLAAEFASRPLGTLSTRDTARATIAGATLSLDYGRPSARGRTIWGGVVPWNEVWRTGANQATHFTTSRDLVIGGTTVPAGTYTLWTLPSPQGTQLIVNRQTGQWGTIYDPAQDLARIRVSLEPLSEPVERFTIVMVPSGAGGLMRLMWANREVRVPFTVR